MSIPLVAALAAIWLTGMIPFLAFDACGALRWEARRQRLAIYLFWPAILLARLWPFLRGEGLRP